MALGGAIAYFSLGPPRRTEQPEPAGTAAEVATAAATPDGPSNALADAGREPEAETAAEPVASVTGSEVPAASATNSVAPAPSAESSETPAPTATSSAAPSDSAQSMASATSTAAATSAPGARHEGRPPKKGKYEPTTL